MSYTFAEARAYVLPFGRYKGRRLEDLARTDAGLLYLDWLVGQDWLRPPAKNAVEAYVGQRAIAKEIEDLLG